MKNPKGDVYKVMTWATEGAGYILEPWEKKVTFEEFASRREVHHWLEPDGEGIGYYFIYADVVQDSSVSALTICGVFTPQDVDKKRIADSLRRFWGEGTELRKR